MIVSIPKLLTAATDIQNYGKVGMEKELREKELRESWDGESPRGENRRGRELSGALCHI